MGQVRAPRRFLAWFSKASCAVSKLKKPLKHPGHRSLSPFPVCPLPACPVPADTQASSVIPGIQLSSFLLTLLQTLSRLRGGPHRMTTLSPGSGYLQLISMTCEVVHLLCSVMWSVPHPNQVLFLLQYLFQQPLPRQTQQWATVLPFLCSPVCHLVKTPPRLSFSSGHTFVNTEVHRLCFKILVTEQLLISVWRLTSVVPGQRRRKPEYGECQASLGYLIMLYLKPTHT